MSNKTAIEWCDATFNPWIGCTRVSTADGGGGGCDNCYAEEQDRRGRWDGGRKHWGQGVQRYRTATSTWQLPLRWNRLAALGMLPDGTPSGARRPRVFCASLADIFDNEVNPCWRSDLIGLVYDTPNLDWLWLTKRIGNVPRLMEECTEPGKRWTLPPNVWLGITVVNQMEADRDIPKLLAIPARVRFLSCEPLLGAIDIREAMCPTFSSCAPPGVSSVSLAAIAKAAARKELGWTGIDWVIAGGESGPKARPTHPDWFRSLRDQCAAAGVPFLFKQWGDWWEVASDLRDDERQHVKVDVGSREACEWFERGDRLIALDGRTFSDPAAIPEDTPCRLMTRLGKKKAGRALDGRTHDGFP